MAPRAAPSHPTPSSLRRSWHRHVRFCEDCKAGRPCKTEQALNRQIPKPLYVDFSNRP